MIVRPSPSWRSWRKATSRLGPTVPLVPARLRVWQDPRLATNSFLPVTGLSLAVLFLIRKQPARAVRLKAAAITSSAARRLAGGMRAGMGRGGPSMRRGTLSGQRPRQRIQPALRRGQNPPGHPIPGEALARGGDQRLACALAQLLGGLQP